MENQCKNCLKVLGSMKALSYHIKNVSCKKIELTDDGKIKDPVDNQCSNCYQIFSNKWNHDIHRLKCINTSNQSSSESPTIKQKFLLIKLKTPIQKIAENCITIDNIYYYFADSIEKTTKSFDLYIKDVIAIIVYYFHNARTVFDIPIWSVKNIKENRFEFFYFKDGEWIFDKNGEFILKNIIDKLLTQLSDISDSIIRLMNAIIDYDIKTLYEYINDNCRNKDFAISTNRNIVFLLHPTIRKLIELYKYQLNFTRGTQEPDDRLLIDNERIYDNTITRLKQYKPLYKQTIVFYEKIANKYRSLHAFSQYDDINIVILNKLKQAIVYEEEKYDQIIDSYNSERIYNEKII